MQVGKKYKFDNTYIYTCVGMTPGGNAIATHEGGEEFLLYEYHIQKCVEVREPIVRYVHWLRRKGGDKLGDDLWVFLNTDPMAYQVHLDRYDHLHTEKVEYVG